MKLFKYFIIKLFLLINGNGLLILINTPDLHFCSKTITLHLLGMLCLGFVSNITLFGQSWDYGSNWAHL